MSNRKNISQASDEILAYVDQNPTDRGKSGGKGGGHDVSNEPRVPKGNPDGGEWTSGGGTGSKGKSPFPGGDPEVYLKNMEPILRDLAQRLGIPEEWILGLSSYESGWMDPHNAALNNPFGLTNAGNKNLGFESIPEAVDYWEQHYGDRVRGSQSAQEFVDRLEDPRLGSSYNSKNPNWKSGVLDNIRSVQNRLSRQRGAQ